jgi:hypothetical protein
MSKTKENSTQYFLISKLVSFKDKTTERRILGVKIVRKKKKFQFSKNEMIK